MDWKTTQQLIKRLIKEHAARDKQVASKDIYEEQQIARILWSVMLPFFAVS